MDCGKVLKLESVPVFQTYLAMERSLLVLSSDKSKIKDSTSMIPSRGEGEGLILKVVYLR